MISLDNAWPGRFCWVDLATIDLEKARSFYAQVFGWRTSERRVNGGAFSLLQLAGQNVGSMYQLDRGERERGVPSHWTPYVQVDDIQEVVRRVALLGGSVLIGPFLVSDIAQIALVLDSAGATIGLWQPAAKGGR